MKKLKILFLSLLSLTTIVSCNKDDDNEPSPTIEAKWQISQEGATLTTLAPVYKAGSCPLDMIEFAKGGIFKEIGAYGDACTLYTDEGTWTKNNNTLVIKDSDDESITYEILELSQTTLKTKSTEEEGSTWIKVYTKK